jgi:hypothetical protein
VRTIIRAKLSDVSKSALENTIAPAGIRSGHIEIAKRLILLTLPGRKVLQEKVHTLSFSLLQPTFLPSNHNQADRSANKQPRQQQ